MRYRETVPTKRWCYVHLALFLALYLPVLGLRELRPSEALVGTVAGEMRTGGSLLATTAHGEHVDSFPLCPWLVTASSPFGRPNAWTTRLPSALAMLGLAGLCGYVAARAGGHLAGAVAAGMVLSSAVSFAEGTRAGSNAVFALLMSASWFSWYRLGRVGRNWSMAWGVSLAFVLVAVFGVGLKAFVYFYFPLFFLRRPLRLLPRGRVPGHALALGCCALVITLWLWQAPRQVLFPWTAISMGSIPERTGSYLLRLGLFPVRCAAYLFPWTLLCWPAFCVAFRPVERTPVFCRFTRTLIYPLFLAAWALPSVSPKALLPLLGPLSVLTGLHFEILIRRHYRGVRRVEKLLLSTCLVAGCAFMFLGALHGFGVVVFGGVGRTTWAFAMTLMLLVVMVARRFDMLFGAQPLWLRLLVLTGLLWLVFIGVNVPLRALRGGGRRAVARRLAESVPLNATVYRAVPHLLLPECFHLGRPVRRVPEGSSLPMHERERIAYVLAGPKPPLLDLDDRVWVPWSDPVSIRPRRSLRFGRGNGRGLLRVDSVVHDDGRRGAVVRMYRGRLRPPSERPAPVPVDSGSPARGGQEASSGETIPQAGP